jgi:hypothetical protein
VLVLVDLVLVKPLQGSDNRPALRQSHVLETQRAMVSHPKVAPYHQRELMTAFADEVAGGGARVASWPSAWRVGSTGWAAPDGTVGTHP